LEDKPMKFNLFGIQFDIIEAKEKITIADSFVFRSNKIGRGNGEAKLYVGNENQDNRQFFGGKGFTIECFLLKRDLLKYLDEVKAEYINPEQPYQNKGDLPQLWAERKSKINDLPEILEFKVKEQTQITGSRIYVKSLNPFYNLIRELSLPNVTYISVIKLLSSNSHFKYYFRLFADYFGEETHPFLIEQEEERIKQLNQTSKKQLIRARVGQGKYRAKLLQECPFCPITMITDDRLLIASHIKPWVKSDDKEKLDPKNGFMFTPTYDFLFDRGYISFEDNKKMIVSPWLSKMTCSKLNINDGKTIFMLPIQGREEYLDY